jgi:hypothetical protein
MTQSISYRRMLTRMGYYNYQNGMIFHHVNQTGGWENHQTHCRSFIIKALELYKPEKVTVLGSGWLLELPFAELIERTGSICLIDIIHPPDVIAQIGNYKNVTGGLIEDIWQKTGRYPFLKKLKSLENIIIPEFKPDSDPGLVISLNILTQLESLIVDFLKKWSKIKKEEFNFFRTEVQRKHIDFLMKHRSVLITDYAEVVTNKSGSVKTIPTLVTDLPTSKISEEWIWNFDQTGADLYNSRSQFKVIGLIN